MKNSYLIFIVALSVSCSTNENTEQELKTLDPIETVELANSKEAFLSNELVQFGINLKFGGRELLDGTLTLATNSSKGRIDYSDGRQILFLEDKVYTDTNLTNSESARFAAYTWSYFFLFPYKLSDPGTNWSAMNKRELNDKLYDSAKLTFGENVGDAPDDWYIAYADTSSHLMEVAAYIVTAGGTSVEEAEEDPHAISYSNYKDVDGIQLAHSWKFWAWRTDSGLTRQLGSAELDQFKFIDAENVDFSVPEGFIEID